MAFQEGDDKIGIYLNDNEIELTSLDAGNIDWTTTLGLDHEAWMHTTSGGPFGAGSGVADMFLPSATNGELQQRHDNLTPNWFMDDANLSSAHYDIPFSSEDISMMDSLWPALPEPGYPFTNWDSSEERLGSDSMSLPHSIPSLVPIRTNSPELETYEPPKKRRRRLPPEVKKMLDECFEEHKADPYIRQEKMKELANKSGLSLRQVRTFFANARARKLSPVSGHRKFQPNQSDNRDIVRSAKEQPDPMQRFLSTSPEDEGISEEVVRNAAGRTVPIGSSVMAYRDSNEADTISMSDTTFSSNSESGSSQASVDSANSRGPRRGRKRQREPTKEVVEKVVRKPINPHKKYQCTFCASDFAQKYDWTRHEESIHFPQKQWICMPYGATYDIDATTSCVFCNEPNPDYAHLDTHNSNACPSISLSSRTFSRKDKLVQHLMQVHRCCQFPKQIEDWCLPIKRSITLVCGLCGLILSDWQSRATHISAHFQSGVGMNKWILEYSGGVVAHMDSSDESIQSMCNIVLATDGDFTCDICPDRFNQLSHVIFHYRQKHNIYSDEDRMLMHAVTWPSDLPQTASRKGIADMAKNSFATKLFKQRNPARRKSLSQVKGPTISVMEKDGQGKKNVEQSVRVPTDRPLSITPITGVQTRSGISHDDLRMPDSLSNKIHPTPSKCKLRFTHHQQVEKVANSHDTFDIDCTMPQDCAVSRPAEHVPADLMNQLHPKNPDGSTRLVPTYLRKAISTYYSVNRPMPVSMNSMTSDTVPQSLIQSQRQLHSPSTSTTQSVPWPENLHEMHRFPIPRDHIPTLNRRPKRATRLSSVSMAPLQSATEHENETGTVSNVSQNECFEFGSDVTPMVDRNAGGNAESAQYKCWNGQTRTPNGVVDSAQYKCWDGQTRMP